MSRHQTQIIVIAALGLIGLSFAQAANFTKGRTVKPFTADLKPEDYLWHPEVSPAGPVVVLVSLPDQVMYVYRNGVHGVPKQCASAHHFGHHTDSHGCAGQRSHPKRSGIQHPYYSDEVTVFLPFAAATSHQFLCLPITLRSKIRWQSPSFGALSNRITKYVTRVPFLPVADRFNLVAFKS